MAGFGTPGRPRASVDLVADAYTLYREFRSFRYVAQQLGISHETVRKYVAEAFHADQIRQNELVVDGEVIAAEELDKARVAGFLEGIAAAGIDRYSGLGGKYENAAPVALKAIDMYIRMKGYYAPTASRMHVTDERTPPTVDGRTAEMIEALDLAEERAAARGRELLSGNEDSS